jgi:hypothetical protein
LGLPVEEAGDERKGKKHQGSPVESPTQQLERAQLAIVELYQENRELQSQLAVKNREVSVSQGHEGSTVWLQRRLREAQDTIVQLREAQRMTTKEKQKTLQGAKDSLREDQRTGDT